MNSILRIFAAALVLAASHASAADRPNILLICIDDLRTQLGCYGDKVVKSPNIDRLSEQGVIFDRCYVQVAVCNPSRASMMTGLRPATLNCYTLPYHFRETKPDAVTMPQYLRSQGYHVEGYGKIFHNPWQDPRSWDRPHQFGSGDYRHYDAKQKAFIEKVRESLPGDDWRKSNLRGPATNAPDITDEQHPDGAMTSRVIERIRKLKDGDKPFFVAAGLILPHLPWCPPKKYWDMYDREKLPLASNPDLPKGVPPVELGTNYEFSHYADLIDFPTPTGGRVSEKEARRLIHGYLASVSFADAQVGRLLGALDEMGLAEDTVVVLWSDHGYKLGEHGGWGKMTNLELDTRVPFIIRDPKAKANGKRCGRLVETVDLFPTLCELAGVKVPGFLEGKSAAALLEDPAADHIGAAFSQYVYRPLIGNSIRTAEWRYTEWREMKDGSVKERVLYDHRRDDSEDVNVADQHPEIIAKLQAELNKTLPPSPVSLRAKVHSKAGGPKTSLEFVNQHDGVVRLTWIDPSGRRGRHWDIGKDGVQPMGSFVGHVFVAESLDGHYFETITVKKLQKDGPAVIELGKTD
ncbi:iduronate-2-sulfatase [Haloferula helveola]|uniref:Iduronate-2-sulfatase n=1 Tax=Haloferula helveola TaxID=490095 RepID=A0ABM7RER8_9BACT|nr:iduronate-2-sulfatase [Haloferula helveola]